MMMMMMTMKMALLLPTVVQPLVVHHPGMTSLQQRSSPRSFQTLQTESSSRIRRRQGVEMNLFDRFLRVAKANLNNILKSWEDPEKVLSQAVEDLNKDATKIRQSYAEISATQKRTERQREVCQDQVEEWMRRAQLAVKNNDEELAREALTRKQQGEVQIAQIDDQLKVQQESLDKLYDSMMTLEEKIEEAKSTKDQYIARARTAKTATKVNDMLSSVNGAGSTSMDAFERMKEKVEMLETKAEVSGQLTGSKLGAPASVESKFRALEAGNKVDDELEAMKSKLLLTAGKEDVDLAKADISDVSDEQKSVRL